MVNSQLEFKRKVNKIISTKIITMKKYIINMLVAIAFATATQAQVPVITTHPQSVTVCAGNTATFSVTATNNPTSYIWEYSFDNGETWQALSGCSNSSTMSTVALPKFQGSSWTCQASFVDHAASIHVIATNSFGNSLPSQVAVLTMSKATDSLFISKPNATPTCVGNSFLLAGSQANGVFSSSNSNVASISCTGMVTVKTQGTSNIKYVYKSTNGCTDTATYVLNTNNPTAAIVSGATSLCVGANTTYTANINNGVWNSNGRLSINATSGVATATSAGTTAVNYTLTGNNGCTTKTVFATTVNALPVVPSIYYTAGTVNPQIGAPTGGFCVGKTFGLGGVPNTPAGVWSATGSVSITSGGIVTINSVGAGSIKYNYTDVNGCSNSRTILGFGYACAAKNSITSTIEEKNTNDFLMYPNPSHSSFNLRVDWLVGSGSMTITDLYGKQVAEQILSLGTNTINIGNLNKGIYLVSIITSEGRKTQKLVIE